MVDSSFVEVMSSVVVGSLLEKTDVLMTGSVVISSVVSFDTSVDEPLVVGNNVLDCSSVVNFVGSLTIVTGGSSLVVDSCLVVDCCIIVESSVVKY